MRRIEEFVRGTTNILWSTASSPGGEASSLGGTASSSGCNASPPSEDAVRTRLPQLETINRSQTTNQSCSISCRPQASGRQPNVHFLTTEAHKIDSKASVFPTSLARSKEKLTRRFFIFLQYFRIF